MAAVADPMAEELFWTDGERAMLHRSDGEAFALNPSRDSALAWVAAGRRASYISDGWFEDNVHFAAGLVLCTAAGCIVSDLSVTEK